MKREQKSLTNKGFSLVELIIVVAIMAVLIGVLAPQYLRYVEKTRLQRDNTSISDFANVLKIASTEEKVNSSIATTPAEYTFDTTTFIVQDSANTALNDEVELTVNLDDIKLTSNTYTKQTSNLPKITVKVSSSTGIVTVECANWIDTPNGKPSTEPKKF